MTIEGKINNGKREVVGWESREKNMFKGSKSGNEILDFLKQSAKTRRRSDQTCRLTKPASV